jgi:hypothetical protein
MVQRERLLRHERDATHVLLRVDNCQFALGFESANLRKSLVSRRKNRRPGRRRSALASATIQRSPSVGRFLPHRQPSLAAIQTASRQIPRTDFILSRDGTEAVGQDVFHNRSGFGEAQPPAAYPFIYPPAWKSRGMRSPRDSLRPRQDGAHYGWPGRRKRTFEIATEARTTMIVSEKQIPDLVSIFSGEDRCQRQDRRHSGERCGNCPLWSPRVKQGCAAGAIWSLSPAACGLPLGEAVGGKARRSTRHISYRIKRR